MRHGLEDAPACVSRKQASATWPRARLGVGALEGIVEDPIQQDSVEPVSVSQPH